jgi:hypothetical protein
MGSSSSSSKDNSSSNGSSKYWLQLVQLVLHCVLFVSSMG